MVNIGVILSHVYHIVIALGVPQQQPVALRQALGHKQLAPGGEVEQGMTTFFYIIMYPSNKG